MKTNSTSISRASSAKLQPEIERVEAELARRGARLLEASLYEFVRQAWRIVEPGKPFQDNWHIRVICALLERVFRREVTRAIINIPPRCMKSTIVSVMFPVWCWLQDPSHQFLTISHGIKLATRDALKARRLIQSPWFQQRWGHRFRITSDQNQKTRYENDHMGYRLVQGMDSGITGEGGDIILLDDPHDAQAANSEADRARALTTFDESISTRLNNPATGAIVIIMQRLHAKDLTGHVLANPAPGENWRHLMLPMEHEGDRACADDPRKHEGELLWPERFTPQALARLKARLGSYGTAGQLQQRPTPRGGGIWKTHWWKFYTAQSLPGGVDEIVQSWDFNFKKTTDGSFIVGQVWARKGAFKYLLDQVRFRGGFVDAKRAITTMSAKWPAARRKLVEAKANGPAISDDLKGTVPGIVLVEVPAADKVARAEAVGPTIEAGDVFLPSPELAPWVREYLAETEAFPNAPNDDQVDATSQALSYFEDKAHQGLRGALQQAYAAGRRR